MASATALQLVNRVLTRMRDPVVTAFTDPMPLAVLDLVNAAVWEITANRKNDFDIRHDGEFLTHPSTTFETAADPPVGQAVLSNTSKTGSRLSSTGTHLTNILGDTDRTLPIVSRMLVAADTNFGSTAFRVNTAVLQGTTLSWVFPNEYAGTTDTTANAKFFAAEYLLPDTVRDLVSIQHDEGPITLEEVDPRARLEELIPRPHDTFDKPRWAGVGGFDVATYDSSGSAPEPRLRLILWPVADEELALRYSYYYRHPRMSAITDVLSGPPEEVISQVVGLAHAEAQATLEKEPAIGLANMANLNKKIEQRENASNRAAGRRNVVHPIGSSHRIHSIHGFPGQTLSE